MSFGFSIGDFIALGSLALQLYDRCKRSVAEFKDISREVSSLHIVLNSIKNSWDAQDLSPIERFDLSELSKGCWEVLKDLETKLNKYQSLGSRWKHPIDRMRWGTQNIAPLRTRLISNVMLLSSFNVTLAQSLERERNVAAEARILEKLNVIHQEFQDGKRAIPAFSRVTLDELDREDEKAWSSINTDLINAGIDNDSIYANHDFIKNWICSVILDDAQEEDDVEVLSPMNLPDNSTENGVDLDPIIPDIGSLNIERPPSTDSHRSQESTWRPVDEPHPAYVQTLFGKLLRLEYSQSGDHELFVLPIKRIYHQLDWLDRGYLLRPDVERHSKLAITKSTLPLDEKTLRDLFNGADPNRTGKIYRPQFVEMCCKLVDLALKSHNELLSDMTEMSNADGKREAKLYYEWLLKEDPAHVFLPWGWEPSTDGGNTYFNELQGVTSQSIPRISQTSFSAMAFTAARIWIPRISQAQEKWGGQLVKLPRKIRLQYQQAFDTVLEAALHFTILEHDLGPTAPSDLDWFLEAADSISYIGVPELNGCPSSALRYVKAKCHDMLSAIGGFTFELMSTEDKEKIRQNRHLHAYSFGEERFCSESLPRWEAWQDLKMTARADLIAIRARKWRKMVEIVKTSRIWVRDNPYLNEKFIEGWNAMKDFKRCQKQETRQLAEAEIARQNLRTNVIPKGWQKRQHGEGRASRKYYVEISSGRQTVLLSAVGVPRIVAALKAAALAHRGV